MTLEDAHQARYGEIARAFEQNMFEFFRLVRQAWPDAARRLAGPIHWSITGENFAPLNSIFDVQLEPAAVAAALAEPVDLADARRVPMMAWITPRSQPAGLATSLQAVGFAPLASWPVMTIDVARVAARVDRPPYTVLNATDRASLGAWSQVIAETMAMAPSTMAHWLERYLALGAGPGRAIECFVAVADGVPLASGMVYFSATSAGIFNVATIPSARRRGLAAQMTHACIDAARARGFDNVALLATGQGGPLYRSMGFTAIEQYDVFRRDARSGS